MDPPATGRSLDPARPWPTAAEQATRIVRLLVMISVLGFVLSGMENWPDRPWMVLAWGLGATLAGIGTYRVETYLFGPNRWRP